VAGILHTLPVQRNLDGARGLGSMMFRFDHRHRERAMANIRRSLPDLDEAQVAVLAEASMQHFMQLGVELMFTTRLVQTGTWTRHIHATGMEQTVDLLLSDRPTILLTGHYGNWEVLGYLLALLGIDLSAVARPIDNPLVNRWLLGVREARGMQIITKFGATDAMVDIMERGGTLAFIADQNAGPKGLFVPFLGRLASSYKSIGLLAIRYNAPVVCGYARRRRGGFGFDVGVTDVIHPEQWQDQADPLYYLTARYVRAIETTIHQDPQQYLWVHRRWKTRPRHELQGRSLPDGLRRQLQALPWMTPQLMDDLQRPMEAPLA
ncbi:MAG: lysophospholipid acyltransferase family protein, partial [Phycisphaerae bacterium]|nr:lysophospholipid acyltransferase family protein [Phycisphaerae bacterium]